MYKNSFIRCKISENPAVREAMQQLRVLLFALTALSGVAYGDVILETGFEGSSSLPTGWTQSQISGGATWTIQEGGFTGGSKAYPSA